MDTDDIKYNDRYVEVIVNNKFEWNTYMVVLSRNGYRFDKGSITEFKGYCYVSFSEIDKLVHVSERYEMSVWHTISMKQFLYKFGMLDKAIGNPKFDAYRLEEDFLDLPDKRNVELIETLVESLSVDESAGIDELEKLYQSNYIGRDDYNELSNYYNRIAELKNVIRGVVL